MVSSRYFSLVGEPACTKVTPRSSAMSTKRMAAPVLCSHADVSAIHAIIAETAAARWRPAGLVGSLAAALMSHSLACARADACGDLVGSHLPR
jgi:hypothetical protein